MGFSVGRANYLHMIVLSFILVAFVTASCTDYPQNPYGEIHEEDWCVRDDGLPWTGCWEEVAQIECGSETEHASEDAIGELRLRSDDINSVTRHPFEHFVDHSGTYTATASTDEIEFGEMDKPGFVGEGTYELRDNGDLVLHDVWFAMYDNGDESTAGRPVTACGYVFRRR